MQLFARLVCGTAIVGAAFAPAAVPASASVAGLTISCTISGTTTFAPGITTTPQSVKMVTAGKINKCPAGAVGTVSGALTSTNQTCSTGNAKGSLIVTWSDNTTTTAAVSQSATGKTLSVKISGKITAGVFKGAAITASIKLTPTVGNCIASPLTTADMTGTTSMS